MIKMKKITFFSIILITFISVFLIVSKIYAQQIFPTITTACENRDGDLKAINDGFSLFKKCPTNSRRVVMIGEQGSKGDKGDQGDMGPVGPKGDQGDPAPGFTPDKWVYVCFHVDTAALTVMKGGTCFPHVTWKIPVMCVPGKPCQPDNPNDSFFDPPL